MKPPVPFELYELGLIGDEQDNFFPDGDNNIVQLNITATQIKPKIVTSEKIDWSIEVSDEIISLHGINNE